MGEGTSSRDGAEGGDGRGIADLLIAEAQSGDRSALGRLLAGSDSTPSAAAQQRSAAS